MTLSPFFHFSKFRGINNVDDPIRLFDVDQVEAAGSTSLVTATDVDISATNMISQRDGYTQRATGNIHSMWASGDTCLFVEGSELKQLNADYSKTVIMSVSAGVKMSYVDMNGVIILTNNQVIGYLSNGVFNDFATPTKYAKIVPSPGHMLELFNGRLLIAQGSKIAFTDTGAINQYDPRKNFHQLSGIITMMKTVSDGVYLSDGKKTYFANGRDFATATLDEVSDYPATPGTATIIDGGLVGGSGITGDIIIIVIIF